MPEPETEDFDVVQDNMEPVQIIQPIGWFGQFMLDCQAAAQTVPAVKIGTDVVMPLRPENVFIGHYEFLVTQEFYQNLKHEGFELFIGSSEGDGDFFNLTGEFSLPVELFYTIPADRPNNLLPIQTMIGYLNVAWSSMFTQWVKGGNRNPLRMKWFAPQVRRHQKPFVVSTFMELTTKYVPDQASDPFLSPKPGQNGIGEQ